MRIIVHGRLRFESDRDTLQSIIDVIESEFEAVVYTKALSITGAQLNGEVIDGSTLEQNQFDCIFSIGGDGTILDTVRRVGRSGIPILGINTGRLGFLSSTQFDELRVALAKLKLGDYQIDERILVQANSQNGIFGDKNFALNEVSIHKSATSSMLVVQAYLDDFFLNTYWSDGLIISTPTGSTGYSLSTGGPIIAPGTSNMIITPIAPHNLNVRPLVISDMRKITLRVEGNDPTFMISIDSQSKIVSSDVEISISKTDFNVGLIRFGPHDYFDTLRGKLMWGSDRRN